MSGNAQGGLFLMKTLVIIPAFNEGENIGDVIKDVKKEFPSSDILVVNDGSTDGTGYIAREMGAIVVDLPYNLGIGAAMQTGYRYAALNQYDIAVQVDGDGQHPANQIGKLVQIVAEGKADMAIGSRFIANGNYKVPGLRLIGIRYFKYLLSLILRQRVSDTTSGFRAANKRVIHCFSLYYPEDYPEVEALILLRRQGLKFLDVPVEMKKRARGRSSITPFSSLYYVIKVTLAVLVNMLRRRE